MKKLLVFDSENYNDSMPVFERFGVRAVIFRDGKMAMQQSAAGEYKIPGGGVEGGETHAETLLREVREEVGLLVIPESIKEIGEIEEIREDVFCKGQKFINHSYYYICRTEDRCVDTQMTASEIAKGFHPVWEFPEVICRQNDLLQGEQWMKRDTEFIRMIVDGRLELDLK